MDVDPARLGEVREAERRLEQLFATEDDSGAAPHREQKIELAGCESHLAAIDGHFARLRVHDEPADSHGLLGGRSDGAGRAASRPCARLGAAAQHRTHASNELRRRERLDEVVVGTSFEQRDLIHVRVTRSEHYDRHPGELADLCGDLGSRRARQHDVEHHQVGREQAHLLHGLGAGLGALDSAPRGRQVQAHEFADVRFVVDDQHRWHRSLPCGSVTSNQCSVMPRRSWRH